uniref:Putative secreted protein n=1 Tax=Rhipicephalus microplus TaxID=6941 RepID=A0A6M2DBY1_RHIMP
MFCFFFFFFLRSVCVYSTDVYGLLVPQKAPRAVGFISKELDTSIYILLLFLTKLSGDYPGNLIYSPRP